MHISVVIPAYDEQGNIGRLVEEIYHVVPSQLLHEVVVVDDGSKDGTYLEVAALIGRYPNLRCLRHGVRSGKSAACRSGIEAAAGPVIACIDGDGQNDPRDIARLMEKLAAPGGVGPSFIAGTKSTRADGRQRRGEAPLSRRLQRKLFGYDAPVGICGPQLFWKEVYLRLPYFDRQLHHLPLLFKTEGHLIDFTPVNYRQRLAGITKGASQLSLPQRLLDLVGLWWLRRRAGKVQIVDEIGKSRRLLYFSNHKRKRI